MLVQGDQMKSTILTSSDIRKIVQAVGVDRLMDELISRLVVAFEAYDPNETVIPVRSGFSYFEPYPGLIEWMPVMSAGSQIAIKVVGYHPENPQQHRLPTIISTISAYDPLTGHLTALADATFITALRTGAASAVASTCLASSRSTIVGLIGAGAQAVTQLHALSRVLPVEKALVYDIKPEVTRSFIERTAFMGLQVEALGPDDLTRLVRSADILCTCTSVGVGEGPVFQDGGLKPWAHINAVGADFPGKFEVPCSVLQKSSVCPDFRAQAVVEGECQQLEANNRAEEIGPELPELVRNRSAYAGLRENMTVFDSTGWALEDQVALGLMLDHAYEMGIGEQMDIEQLPVDPQDPYEPARHPVSQSIFRQERI
jgi:ornithine cyclodeaminase/alanine dehydrogenase-like protein (mu-crystallin family)